MKVPCEVEFCELDTGDSRTVAGVLVTCSRCDYAVESFGQTERSVRRCFAMLRSECPEDEENFYFDENEPDA